MNLEKIRFGMTPNNDLGILIFKGLKKPTPEITEFIEMCSISGNFKIVMTGLGLGVICPGLKQQMHLYFEAGEYWRKTIKKLDSPVEILVWNK